MFTPSQPPDREAFEQAYKNNRHAMFAVAYSILKDANYTEDAIQESFYKLVKSKKMAEYFKLSNDAISNLLVIICRNVALTMLKKVKRNNAELLELEDMVEDTFENNNALDYVLSEELLQMVKDVLKEMDPIYADVFTLRYFYDYSTIETAALLTTTEVNVRVRLHRAKKMIREILLKGGVKNE
jgi:RNA polymerase sigma-70 factor (ECF subfamily)